MHSLEPEELQGEPVEAAYAGAGPAEAGVLPPPPTGERLVTEYLTQPTEQLPPAGRTYSTDPYEQRLDLPRSLRPERASQPEAHSARECRVA